MPKQYPPERVKELARILDITPDEVIEMLNDDERIDKGEKLFELTPEQEKASKKARQVARGTSTTSTKREKKSDTDKAFLIGLFEEKLNEFGDVTDLVIVNPERELTFTLNNRKFKVVLSAPRT